MHAVGVDDVVRVLAAVLQRHGITQAHLIGHSFGTFVVAHMRKLFPETVSSVLLCDPVCMLTCFPKLLYNFIYRGVSFRELLDDPVEMARWLVARDLCIASTFCRHFFWCAAYQNDRFLCTHPTCPQCREGTSNSMHNLTDNRLSNMN
jgi:pimeloyl-ACP methyl ester carboxylesterase